MITEKGKEDSRAFMLGMSGAMSDVASFENGILTKKMLFKTVSLMLLADKNNNYAQGYLKSIELMGWE